MGCGLSGCCSSSAAGAAINPMLPSSDGAAGNPSSVIVLLGDSLINRPWNEHGLGTKIQSLVVKPAPSASPNINLTLINSGVNGQVIAQILSRTPSVLQTYNPNAVIIFWDSDCSNIDESTMTAAQIAELRATYKSNVTDTCTLILQSGASLALSGPEVLGEGPLCLPSRFRNKNGMLDAYRTINQEVAVSLEIPYIDMRKAFQDDEACYPCSRGRDTIDGEHPNERGTQIEANLFAEQIKTWLYGSNAKITGTG